MEDKGANRAGKKKNCPGESNESLPRGKEQCSRLTEKRSSAAAAYAALQASEDELIAEHCLESEDAALKTPGSETEDTEDNGGQMEKAASSPGRRFTFLRRFRSPRFGEAHHKRVPTPMKRKYRRKKSKDDIINNDMNAAEVEPPSLNQAGVPDPYYPIYLPIDQAFKAKYVFHHKKGKTFQERLYVFLEHPGGWICFIYHFTVWVHFVSMRGRWSYAPLLGIDPDLDRINGNSLIEFADSFLEYFFFYNCDENIVFSN